MSLECNLSTSEPTIEIGKQMSSNGQLWRRHIKAKFLLIWLLADLLVILSDNFPMIKTVPCLIILLPVRTLEAICAVTNNNGSTKLIQFFRDNQHHGTINQLLSSSRQLNTQRRDNQSHWDTVVTVKLSFGPGGLRAPSVNTSFFISSSPCIAFVKAAWLFFLTDTRSKQAGAELCQAQVKLS